MRIARAILALSLTALSVASPSPGAARIAIVEGNPASSVRVVIYEDLQCDDCQRFRTMLDEKILPHYGSRVAFVHRDFPLPKHDWARNAAIAARWVYDRNPELGIIFRRELMSEQDHITPENLKPWLLEFAARNKLDEKGILDSLNDQRLGALVDQDYQAAVARGVQHTPTIYVEGRVFAGTIVYDEIAGALDQALAR